MKFDDLSFFSDIRNECCEIYLHDPRKFTLKQTQEWFLQNEPEYWIINHENQDIGYFRVNKNKDLLYIGADLHKKFRGIGLGYHSYIKFIPFIMNEHGVDQIFLEVLSTNIRAIDLYKKIGFKELEVITMIRDKNQVDSIKMSYK